MDEFTSPAVMPFDISPKQQPEGFSPQRRWRVWALRVLLALLAVAAGWVLHEFLRDHYARHAKLMMASAGFFLMPAFWLVDRRGLARVAKALTWLLAVLAVAAIFLNGNFRDVSKRQDRGLFVWNMFHYVLGTKYFDEVGYFDLYRAAIVADDEGKKVFAKHAGHVRDMHTYRFTPYKSALLEAQTDNVKGRFSEKRWKAFKKDLGTMLSLKSTGFWVAPLSDRGFNPSPAWLIVHRPLLNAVKIHKKSVLVALGHVNTVMLLATMAALWWAFGLRHMLISTLWFMVFFGNQGRVFGGYFTYNWFFFFIVFVCLQVRGWPAVGAPALAYSGMMRGFTGLAAIHAAVRWIAAVVRRQRPPKRLTVLLTVLAIGCLLCVGLGSATKRGFGAWEQWRQKIAVHTLNHNSTKSRIGLQFLFAHAYTTGKWETSTARIKNNFKRHKTAYRAVSYTLIALTLLAMARRREHDGLLLFIPIVFFAMILSRYYFSVAILLFTWREFDRRGIGALLSSCWLFFILVFFYQFDRSPAASYRLWWWINVLLTAYFVAIVGYFLAKDARDLWLARRARLIAEEAARPPVMAPAVAESDANGQENVEASPGQNGYCEAAR